MSYDYIMLCFSAGVSLKEWIDIHELLSKTICRAAKVALGKDVSKVQRYTMSGKIFTLKLNYSR